MLRICLKVLKTPFRRKNRVCPWCARHTLRRIWPRAPSDGPAIGMVRINALVRGAGF